MCGIIGLYSSNPTSDFESRLHAGLNAMHHRGPDDQGLYIQPVEGGTLAFGHKRLSIIDLSPGGHQPMHSSDGRYTIVYNGEIYNYKELRGELREKGYIFYTESDTEVLVSAWSYWGQECFRRLTGMFAFVVFDHLTKNLTLVRDAFGIKPLYYHWDKETFSFASEIPALLLLNKGRPRLNLQKAYDYLAWGMYDNQDATFFEGIRHLPPGNWVQISLTSLSPSNPIRWWWPDISERHDLTFNQASEKLREMFIENVRLHLRSDVPLGVALSGGIDSSAVVCAMRLIDKDMPIQTFTFTAKGSVMNEEKWADIINDHVRAIAHKIVVTSDELAVDLDDIIRAQGEPFGSTSIYAQYRVFKMARERGITVLLEGQGADELLAGYDGYPGSRISSFLDRGEYSKLIQFLWGWSRWSGRRNLYELTLRKFLPERLYANLFSNKDLTRTNWLDHDYFAIRNIDLIPMPIGSASPDKHARQVVNFLREVLTEKGLQSLLRHSDRNAMHWTIESRVPFLTPGLAEFLLSLPEHFLISQSGETKSIFRHAMRGIVPNLILDRRDKIGFVTPEQDLLRKLDGKTNLWLKSAYDLPFIKSFEVNKYFNNSLHQQNGFDPVNWRLLNFCRWFELTNPSVE